MTKSGSSARLGAGTSELVADEMTRRELRTARKLTQVRLARTLGTTQDSVGRMEK